MRIFTQINMPFYTKKNSSALIWSLVTKSAMAAALLKILINLPHPLNTLWSNKTFAALLSYLALVITWPVSCLCRLLHTPHITKTYSCSMQKITWDGPLAIGLPKVHIFYEFIQCSRLPECACIHDHTTLSNIIIYWSEQLEQSTIQILTNINTIGKGGGTYTYLTGISRARHYSPLSSSGTPFFQ